MAVARLAKLTIAGAVRTRRSLTGTFITMFRASWCGECSCCWSVCISNPVYSTDHRSRNKLGGRSLGSTRQFLMLAA
jgi:hypothetical protein